MDSDTFYKVALAEIECVHRLAFHLSRDRHQAEDLVQETYLRAMRSMDSYQPGEFGMRPWLFKILHNTLSTIRSRQRRRQDVFNEFAALSSRQAAAVDRSALDGLDLTAAINRGSQNEIDTRLLLAIQGLPIAHRTVFLLSAVENLKYREIAEVVGVPVGTVMSRLSRARLALSAQLDSLASERNLRRRTPGSHAQHSRKA